MQPIEWNQPSAQAMPKIAVTVDKTTGKPYVTITLNGGMTDPVFYFEVVHCLESAQEGDTIHLLINTPGGDVRTGFSIISAIEQCRGTVITEVTGWAYSCGAYIWSFGHKRRMGRFAKLMWHTSSHGDGGKTRDIAENAVNLEKNIVVLLDKIVAKGILTPEDKEFCLEQKKDLYYFYQDMKNRGVLDEQV
jgi:ATP-dependent protease ClpP protease subunit